MYPNPLKQKLRNGEIVLGSGLLSFTPHEAGAIFSTGIDFMWIDTEHLPYATESLDVIPVLARQAGVAPTRTPLTYDSCMKATGSDVAMSNKMMTVQLKGSRFRMRRRFSLYPAFSIKCVPARTHAMPKLGTAPTWTLA